MPSSCNHIVSERTTAIAVTTSKSVRRLSWKRVWLIIRVPTGRYRATASSLSAALGGRHRPLARHPQGKPKWTSCPPHADGQQPVIPIWGKIGLLKPVERVILRGSRSCGE